MPDQIHLIIHIGTNLLIVISRPTQGCLFRLVNGQGVILEEQSGFESPAVAEAAGRKWLETYLEAL